MGIVISLEEVKVLLRAQKAKQDCARILAKLQGHEDFGIICNMLEEYGPATLLNTLRAEYGVDLAL